VFAVLVLLDFYLLFRLAYDGSLKRFFFIFVFIAISFETPVVILLIKLCFGNVKSQMWLYDEVGLVKKLRFIVFLPTAERREGFCLRTRVFINFCPLN